VIILALDTTTEFGSVALRIDGRTAAEIPLHSRDGFAHVIFGHLDQILQRAGIPLEAVDCFGAAAGPGSFTGVRVGLTAAKGLAEALNKPVSAISNLRALAFFGSSDRRAVLLDARRGDVYAGLYNARLQPIQPEVVTKLPVWLEQITTDTEFITMTGAPFRTALTGSRFDGSRWTEAPRSLAPAIAYCAELDLQQGAALDPISADANYVRRADAELFWRDR
jgi:tRNA threonylcarbamoyladenosine biosynthesis protein TsaB